MRFMEDINNILYSGEVPNIFTVDEKLEIIENMRNLEKQLDKSQHTDGSGTGKFLSKISEKNFKISKFLKFFRTFQAFRETSQGEFTRYNGNEPSIRQFSIFYRKISSFDELLYPKLDASVARRCPKFCRSAIFERY